MFADSNDEIEKQLQDLKFKRKVQFVDDTLSVECKAYSVRVEK